MGVGLGDSRMHFLPKSLRDVCRGDAADGMEKGQELGEEGRRRWGIRKGGAAAGRQDRWEERERRGGKRGHEKKGRELLTGWKEGEGTGGEGGSAKYTVRGSEQERGRRPDRAPETQ